MKGLYHIRAILVKDFLDSVKNRTVFFSILFPVILSILFRIVFSPANLPVLKLAVVNDPRSELSTFITVNSFGNIQIVPAESVIMAKKLVEEGAVQGAMVLPDGFTHQVKFGKSPAVDFWVDSSSIARAAVLEMMVNKILYHYNNQLPPAELIVKNIKGKDFGPGTAMLPTWVMFTILGAFMVVTSSIMEERERKTLNAVLVTPCGLPQVLVGKGLLGFLLTTAGALMILSFNGGFIGCPSANIAIIITGAMFFTFLGILTGLVLPSQTTANAFGSIIFMGMFLPVVMAQSSKLMKSIAVFLPSYYVSEGIDQAMFSGAGFDKLWFHLCFLLLSSLFMLALSIMVLKHKENL